MVQRTVSPEDLARLARLREAAEREYNDALTRLDQALPRPFEAPPRPFEVPPRPFEAPPRPFEAPPRTAGPDDDAPALDPAALDPATLDPAALDPAALDPAAAGPWRPPAGTAAPWLHWLHRLLDPIVGPAFERQQRVNRALVEQSTQRAAAAEGRWRHAEQTAAAIATHLGETLAFQSRLLQYLQRITALVDTKDREVAGLMRRINEDNGAAIGGATAALEALAERQRGLRESVQVLHGASRVAARELHRLRDRVSEPDAAPGTASAPAAGAGAGGTPPAATPPPLADAATYAIFEDAFRGPPAAIAARQRRYVACFDGASDVLDIGCGRGEFLELLREAGIGARGIDANAEMVERSRERGLDVTRADALAHVVALPEESLGGLFAAQVVEHLEADYLLALLAALRRALRPGARIVLETINPASWSAFFSAYIRDITHRHPLHPDTLSYLLRAHGFVDVEIVYSAPVPDAGRLRRIPAEAAPGDTPAAAALRVLIEAFNGNVDRLNGLLFAHQDYAAVGTRA